MADGEAGCRLHRHADFRLQSLAPSVCVSPSCCADQVVSAHEDVRNASLLTLSCTHRTALDAYDDKAARAKLGEIAKKDGPLGLLMGESISF